MEAGRSECEQQRVPMEAKKQNAKQQTLRFALYLMYTFTPLHTNELLPLLGLDHPKALKQRKAAFERVAETHLSGARANVIIDEGSTSTLTIRTATEVPRETSCVFEVTVEKNAKLVLTYFENRPTNEHSLVILKVTIHENAHLDLLTAFTGSASSSLFLEIIHSGQGSSSTQHTLFFGDNNQQFDIFSTTILDAPDATTNILAKGVLNNQATCRFDGAINITPRGNNTSGHLHEHTLLLSPDARVNAIPALKIEHNNVQASHSASVTRVDDEHLFYCGARGIDEQTATKLIVDGFLGEMYRETILADELDPLLSEKIAHLA